MFLILAVVFFGLYVANVFLGALARNAFMGDVSEMIVLFLASIAFTVAILKRETDAKKRRSDEENILKGGIE